jgi:toxin ParE1/3/4
MAQYRLSPAAIKDLESIWQYTQQQWGVDQAQRYFETLVSAFESIAQTPNTSPACDHIRAGYRSQLIEKHVIYFRITTDGVDVIRILHVRMDAPQQV